MPDEEIKARLAKEQEDLRVQRARSLERDHRADVVAESKAREDLAAKLAYDRGAEAARIDERLGHLDGAVARINGGMEKTAVALEGLREESKRDIHNLREDMTARFEKQADVALTTKAENRKLTLQVFSAVLVATIGAASVIVVALIGGPTP